MAQEKSNDREAGIHIENSQIAAKNIAAHDLVEVHGDIHHTSITVRSDERPDIVKALIGLAKAVLITGALGVSSLLLGAAIAVCSAPVAYSVITSSTGSHLPPYMIVMVILGEIACLAIVIELCLVGVTFFIKSIATSLIKLGQAMGQTGQLWRLGESGRLLDKFGDMVGEAVARLPKRLLEWLLVASGVRSGRPWQLLALVVVSFVAAVPTIHDWIVKGPAALLDRSGIEITRAAWLESVKIFKLALGGFGVALVSFVGKVLSHE